jgi:hypothetical protein
VAEEIFGKNEQQNFVITPKYQPDLLLNVFLLAVIDLNAKALEVLNFYKIPLF